jgi:hypothetical protein
MGLLKLDAESMYSFDVHADSICVFDVLLNASEVLLHIKFEHKNPRMINP